MTTNSDYITWLCHKGNPTLDEVFFAVCTHVEGNTTHIVKGQICDHLRPLIHIVRNILATPTQNETMADEKLWYIWSQFAMILHAGSIGELRL